jgi:extradiol dioxygenase family protein
MLGETKAFSGFSVDDLPAAKKFYGETLGIKVSEEHDLLTLHIAGVRTSLSIQRTATPPPRSRSSTSRSKTSIRPSTS